MWFCFYCKHLSPPGRYCAFCGRTRGRICQRGHLSASYVTHCPVCGSNRLTEPTAWLPLSCVSLLVNLILAVVLFRWAAGHVGQVLCALLGGVEWAICLLTGATPSGLRQSVAAVIAWGITILVISYMLPAPAGAAIRRGMVYGLWLAWSLLSRLLQTVWAARPKLLDDPGEDRVKKRRSN